MDLSEREEKVLREMEREFSGGQSHDAARVQVTPGEPSRARSKKRVGIAVLVVVGGLCLLVAGVGLQQVWLGVAAFVVMLAGAVFGLSGGSSGGGPENRGGGGGGRRPVDPATDGPAQSRMMETVEERWERRRRSQG